MEKRWECKLSRAGDMSIIHSLLLLCVCVQHPAALPEYRLYTVRAVYSENTTG